MRGETVGRTRAVLGVDVAVLLAPELAPAQIPAGPAGVVAPSREELEQRLRPGVTPPQPPEELGIEEAEPEPAPVPTTDIIDPWGEGSSQSD